MELVNWPIKPFNSYVSNAVKRLEHIWYFVNFATFFFIFVYTEEALEPQELDFIFELFFDVRGIIS